MENVISCTEQITPDWLTAVLRAQGTLQRGVVMGVTPGPPQSTFASTVWRLQAAYSPDASPGAPRRLFLKVSNPALVPGEFDPRQLRQEFDFYHQIAPAMNAPFTIPCYHTAYEAVTGATHLLLKDVTETHRACAVPPSQTDCEQIVDSLARLHAFWWDHPRLGKDIGSIPTQAQRQQEWADTEKSTSAFLAVVGDQFPFAWRANYEQVLAALPDLFKRHASGRNLTLVHGDAHPGNFLFPINAQVGGAYVLDWQFWHATIAGTDLAFLMATDWPPETRRLLEAGLLRRYYRALLAQGVRDYSWDECWNDYRLSVILVSIFIPVWRWSLFQWAPDLAALNSSMTAFEELHCSELLGTK